MDLNQEDVIREFERELFDLVTRYEALELPTQADHDQFSDARQALREKFTQHFFSTLKGTGRENLEVPFTTLLDFLFRSQQAALNASTSMMDKVDRINQRLALGPNHRVSFDSKPFNRYIGIGARLYLLKHLLPFFELEDYERTLVEAEIQFVFTPQVKTSVKGE